MRIFDSVETRPLGTRKRFPRDVPAMSRTFASRNVSYARARRAGCNSRDAVAGDVRVQPLTTRPYVSKTSTVGWIVTLVTSDESA